MTGRAGSPSPDRRRDSLNLHLKADALGRKVRTKKITDQDGEGLAFQFIPPEEEELVAMSRNDNPNGTDDALEQPYLDALGSAPQPSSTHRSRTRLTSSGTE